MEYGGRSPEERAAAREARERARVAREQGVPLDDDEREAPQGEGGWDPPELDSMSRYGGGPSLPEIDVYQRRRLIAIGAVLLLIVLLFLLLGGC